MISSKFLNGNDDLSQVNYIRKQVFVLEQNVPEELEWDGSDINAVHVLVFENNTPVATGRVIVINGQYTIGRMAVLKEYRGKSYGDFTMRLLIRKAFDLGGTDQYIHAQTHACEFYKKLGFVQLGEEFLEANIPHVTMVHYGDVGGSCKK